MARQVDLPCYRFINRVHTRGARLPLASSGSCRRVLIYLRKLSIGLLYISPPRINKLQLEGLYIVVPRSAQTLLRQDSGAVERAGMEVGRVGG